MADRTDRAQAGLREVLIVAAAAVAAVLGAAILTSFLPTEVERAVFHAPVLIAVLIGGTAFVLWRVATASRRPSEPPGADGPPIE